MTTPAESNFGITAHRPGDPGRSLDVAADEWAIWLPHRCDEWIIACDTSRDAVLALARKFRAELDTAIAALEGSQP